MTTTELLENIAHRPFALPEGKWKFYQEWNHVVFLHWKVDPQKLKDHLPSSLEIDLHDGDAWVSIVAFRMEKVRPRGLPEVEFISNFDEINIRTYVKYKGKPAVHFLNIEAGKWLSTILAGSISGLPYTKSKIHSTSSTYKSTNGFDSLDLSIIRSGNTFEADNLDLWLTERYALAQGKGSQVTSYDIHHVQWPLEEVQLDQFSCNYPKYNALLKGRPLRTHYSSGVQVLAWPKIKVK